MLTNKANYFVSTELRTKTAPRWFVNRMVCHPRCVFINYIWLNQLSNITNLWWIDVYYLVPPSNNPTPHPPYKRRMLNVTAYVFLLTQPEDGHKRRNM